MEYFDIYIYIPIYTHKITVDIVQHANRLCANKAYRQRTFYTFIILNGWGV